MVEAGSSARMECAAQGVPAPKVTWKKDFGADFHAAIERRINSIQHNYDQFTSFNSFIMQRVKGDDTGVYTCTAENPAGIISWNMSLSVLDYMPRCVCSLGYLNDAIRHPSARLGAFNFENFDLPIGRNRLKLG